jgi:hypothetical protein
MFNGMYFILTSCGLLIICTYILVGRSRTTIIPCIHSTWYKIFTIMLIIMALMSLITSGLETRKLKNGTTTIFPEFDCSNMTLCIPVGKGQGDSDQ